MVLLEEERVVISTDHQVVGISMDHQVADISMDPLEAGKEDTNMDPREEEREDTNMDLQEVERVVISTDHQVVDTSMDLQEEAVIKNTVHQESMLRWKVQSLKPSECLPVSATQRFKRGKERQEKMLS